MAKTPTALTFALFIASFTSNALATPEEDAWAERQRELGEGTTLAGGIGLLRLRHADTGVPGQLRIGFGTEYFSAGFLCTADQPCADPRGGAQRTSDTMTHTGATLTLDVGLTKIGNGTLALFATTNATSASDAANQPSLMHTFGDASLGLAWATPLSKIFRAGAAAEMWIYNGATSVGPDFGATTAKLSFLGTADLRSIHAPLRFSANLGYTLDNSGSTISDFESSKGVPITRIERFALGVNRVDHVDFRIGGEAFVFDGYLRPFVEYGLLLPFNRQSYTCTSLNRSHDFCIASKTTVPSTLSLGARVLPWGRGLSFSAAVDVGVTGTGNFVAEVAPTPPWMLHFGAGWAFDTKEPPERVRVSVVEKKVEIVKAPIVSHLHGRVHEKDKGVARAIVAYDGRPEMLPLSTNDEGRFGDDVPPGEYRFNVSADGYKPATCAAKVPETGGDVEVDCAIEALPKIGSIAIMVRDADSGGGVAGAKVRVVDSQQKEWPVTTDAGGAAKVDGLPPGPVQVFAIADDHLLGEQDGAIEVRATARVDVPLRHKPKASLIEIAKTTIRLKAPIQFAAGTSVLAPESNAVLAELADALVRNPGIKRIEIQSHTDEPGTPEEAADLSNRRANAVRDWLVHRGVAGDRLIARGMGKTKPPRRRIEVNILERDDIKP